MDLTKNLEERKKAIEQIQQTDLDDYYIAAAPLYRQLLDLVADDHAIEDTLYYLGKQLQSKPKSNNNGYDGKTASALTESKMSDRNEAETLSVHFKYVRTLASEQFFRRALALKIRQQMGTKHI